MFCWVMFLTFSLCYCTNVWTYQNCLYWKIKLATFWQLALFSFTNILKPRICLSFNFLSNIYCSWLYQHPHHSWPSVLSTTFLSNGILNILSSLFLHCKVNKNLWEMQWQLWIILNSYAVLQILCISLLCLIRIQIFFGLYLIFIE